MAPSTPRDSVTPPDSAWGLARPHGSPQPPHVTRPPQPTHPHLSTRPGVDAWTPVDGERWQMAGIPHRQERHTVRLPSLGEEAGEGGDGRRQSSCPGDYAAGTASPRAPLRRLHRLRRDRLANAASPPTPPPTRPRGYHGAGCAHPIHPNRHTRTLRLGLASTPGHPLTARDGKWLEYASARGVIPCICHLSARRGAGEGGEEAGGKGVDATTQGPGRPGAEEPMPCRAKGNRRHTERSRLRL